MYEQQRDAILCLDLATKTGWACWGPRRSLAHGVWDLPRTGDDVAAFIIAFRNALTMTLRDSDVGSVVFEAPIIHSTKPGNITTQTKLIGLAVMTEVVCMDLSVRCTSEHAARVMKHFTGDGGGKRDDKKRRVIEACEIRGWKPEDDNAADALALLDFVCHSRGIPVPWPCGALFAEKTRS